MGAVPFTLSHAAAALPFRRTRLIFSAVVIGSFSPDFEYFLRLRAQGGFGHTLPGLFTFDLPAGLIVLWLFQRFARKPMVSCLPEAAQQRLGSGPGRFSFWPLSRFCLVLLSLLTGAATHILWDSFTHPRFWFYEHWPLLHRVVWVPLFGPREFNGVLQYLSSALGLLIILAWSIHWYRITEPTHPKPEPRTMHSNRVAVASILAIALFAGVIRATASGLPHGVTGSQRFMTGLAVTAITIFSLGVTGYGAVRELRGQQTRERAREFR